MPKKAISVTLDETNLIWLKGRARVLAGGSLSEAIDQLIAEARAGRLGVAEPARSVVGTIDVPDDGVLMQAAEELRGLLTTSLSRPIFVHEGSTAYRTPRRKK